MSGQLRACSLLCLKTLAKHGPSSIHQLNKLAPDNGDHKPIINGLRTQQYVQAHTTLSGPEEPVRYRLTEKALAVLDAADLATTASKPIKQPKAPPVPRYVSQAVVNFATPIRITNSTTTGPYLPDRHSQAQPIRPGADAALALPSRHFDELHYRDGRVAPVTPMETPHV